MNWNAIKGLNPYSKIKKVEGESIRLKSALREVATRGQKTREIALDWRTRMPEQTLAYLYNLANSNRTLKFTIKAIRDEIFRPGFEWEERFACKCLDCEAEYEYKAEKCRCGCKTFTEPNLEQQKHFKTLVEKANATQSLEDVLMQISLDWDTVDEGWIICKKNYLLFETDPEADNYGEIAGTTPVEIRRGDPLIMRYVIDEEDTPGGDIWICLVHREKIHKEQGKCTECSRKLYQAIAAALGKGPNGDDLFYIEGEVHHSSKHNPTELYSAIPPVMECYFEIFSLIWGAYNIKNYYENDWMAGFFSMNTDNPGGAFDFWNKVKADLQANRYQPVLLPFSSKDGKGKVEFHGVSDIFKEANHQSFRDSMERAVATHYGVSNVFRGDVSTGAGLSNQGMEITVTVRACDVTQERFHKGPIRFLMEQFRITDYVWKFKSVEEKDEAAEVQLDILKTGLATQRLQLGYIGTINPEGEWDFAYNPEKAKELLGGGAGMEQRSPLELSEGVDSRFTGEPAIPHTTMKSDAPITSDTAGNLQERINDDEIIKHTLEDTHDSKAFLDPNKEKIMEMVKAGFLWDSFKEFSAKEVNRVHDILFEKMTQPQGWSVHTIIKALQKEFPSKEFGQLQNIVRTETREITNTAREFAYKETDTPQMIYRWAGPMDRRTTKICKEIHSRVGTGKSLKAVKGIVHEVAAKYEADDGGTPDRNLTPHYGCRHTLSRTFGGAKAAAFLNALEKVGDEEIIKRFKDGESAHSISKALGVKRREVDRAIREGIDAP